MDLFYGIIIAGERGMQQITKSLSEELEQRIIDACKNDLGHTHKLCLNDI